MGQIKKKSLDNLACFIALTLAAAILVITKFLPGVGVSIDGKILGILEMIQNIALLIGVGFGAFHYTSRSTLLRIIFYVAVVIYVGVVFFNIF